MRADGALGVLRDVDVVHAEKKSFIFTNSGHSDRRATSFAISDGGRGDRTLGGLGMWILTLHKTIPILNKNCFNNKQKARDAGRAWNFVGAAHIFYRSYLALSRSTAWKPEQEP